MDIQESALPLFVNAVTLASSGLYIEAIAKFMELGNQYPKSELVDDALYNAGLCHFQLNSFETAISTFRTVINDYPEASIYTYGQYNEQGKTAAKCHYAIVNCYLGLDKREDAEKELQALKAYSDSYIQPAEGKKTTFYELAQNAIRAYLSISDHSAKASL